MDRLKKAKVRSDLIRKDALEMGVLKSEFDIEKFTVRKEGNFIAHNFHFLMRQYSLAMYELKRLLLDVEENDRKIAEYGELDDPMVIVVTDKGEESKYVDIEIDRLKNQNELHELSIVNKSKSIEHFEKCRLLLIKQNGEKFTNEQYQKEMPAYWKWYLSNRAIWQSKERVTGIREGVWENIDHLEQPVLLNPDFQVLMLKNGGLNLPALEQQLEIDKNIPERIKKILGSNGDA